MMVVMVIVFMLWVLFSWKGVFMVVYLWCVFVFWLVCWMVGMKIEVCGILFEGEVLVVGKYQLFFDIIMIYYVVLCGWFIMKKELFWIFIVGQYGLKIGCILVDCGKKGQVICKMVVDVVVGWDDFGQLIIFLQGICVFLCEECFYKIGSGVLYSEFVQCVVLVVVNVGLFWFGYGIMCKLGIVVIEFLELIEVGLFIKDFMVLLEEWIEMVFDVLMDEVEQVR